MGLEKWARAQANNWKLTYWCEDFLKLFSCSRTTLKVFMFSWLWVIPAFHIFLIFLSRIMQVFYSFYKTGCAISLKKKGREKPVPECNLNLQSLMGIAWLLYSFFSQCTRYAQNYSSSLNLQGMYNIIQVNVNISNTHWRWKSIWVIKGNTSVSQVSGKLQIVQVGKRFELKLYWRYWGSTVLLSLEGFDPG